MGPRREVVVAGAVDFDAVAVAVAVAAAPAVVDLPARPSPRGPCASVSNMKWA